MSKKNIMEPYEHILKTQKEDIRNKFILCFNEWTKNTKENLEIIENIILKIHNSFVLLDDIEDNSYLRNGIPCSHTIYGIPQTINTSNYVYFDTIKELQKYKNDSVNILLEELILLHEGQGIDIYWRENNICPTEKEYLEMVVKSKFKFIKIRNRKFF
jgi:geranylgeranyl diphosphate synthase, type III